MLWQRITSPSGDPSPLGLSPLCPLWKVPFLFFHLKTPGLSFKLSSSTSCSGRLPPPFISLRPSLGALRTLFWHPEFPGQLWGSVLCESVWEARYYHPHLSLRGSCIVGLSQRLSVPSCRLKGSQEGNLFNWQEVGQAPRHLTSCQGDQRS